MGRIYRRTISQPFVLLFFLFTVFAGCETAFDPLKESENLVFSVNGILDTSADTQWVRVMPVRESVRQSPEPEPIGATVELTHLASGESSVLQDSLIYFRGTVSATDGWIYSYWTTMDLEPEETYRLVVKNPDGKTSKAIVTLPADFPKPSFFGNDMTIQMADLENLVDVGIAYYFINTETGNTRRVTRPLLGSVQHNTFYGYYLLRFGRAYSRDSPIDLPGDNWEPVRREIYISAGAPDWPPFYTMDELALQLPDAFSNVENGVGFVAGIVTKTIPLCYDADSGSWDICSDWFDEPDN